MVSMSGRGATALWPPDDTEQSIVGVDRHQGDIFNLRLGINEEALARAGGGPVPWQAISQILLRGCRRWDGSDYPTYPDVMVFSRPMDVERGSYTLAHDGPPALIIEVASTTTYRADLHERRGTPWTYARAGVREYLALDPTGAFIPGRGQGWKLVDGVARPWLPDATGRWQSEMIGVALGVEDGLAAVYGADGWRKAREGEVGATIAASRAEGREEGRLEGRIEGLRQGIMAVLQVRLGAAATPVRERLATINDPTLLETLLRRLPDLTTPAEIQAVLAALLAEGR